MEKEQYFNIKRPEKSCLLCGCSLIEAEKHPSILVQGDAEPLRKDFCPKCWERLQDREYFSYWITKRLKPAKGGHMTRKERNDLLLRMFESLYEHNDEKNATMLFYLVHLLMRYKIFNWKGTRSIPADTEKNLPERTILVFENKQTGEEIHVPDQTLDGEKISNAKKEIDEYLKTNMPEGASQNSESDSE